MKNFTKSIISGADSSNQDSGAIDTGQCVSASFQAFFGDTNAGGTFKIQASNDVPVNVGGVPQFVPTNWVDVPNQSATIVSGGSALLTIANMCYRWIKALYTTTATGAQHIIAIADTGVKQVQTVSSIADTGAKEVSDVTCVGDTLGSLNSTYFTFASALDATHYYVWYDDGAGVDPAIPGATPIQVIYTIGDSADTIAGLTRSAVTSIAGADVVVTGATDHVIITNKLMGNSTNAANGTASPGFSYSITPGAASNLNSKYYTLSSINLVSKAQKNFYMWFNVNSQGVDPAIAGKTAIPIAVAPGDSANTIATAMRAALNALSNDFAATGSNAAVITADLAYGPVTAAVDGVAATGFTFGAATAGVVSNLTGKYFTLNRQGQPVPSGGAYYVWFNVDTISTDPAPAGKVGVPVAISSGASANTIGGLMATAIAAINSSGDFSAVNTTGNVLVTNLTAGPFTPAADVNSGFTFSVSAGGTSTVTVNMNYLSV